MKLKDQIKNSWPFALATLILIVLVILQVNDIYKNDTLFGVAYILLAATLPYSTFKGAGKLEEHGYKFSTIPIFASGVLSGIWLVEALERFF